MSERKTVRCRSFDNQWTDVPVEELSFRPSIYAVVVQSGKVLLHGYRGGWDFPGGGIDLGETLDEALEREIREETGLKARRGKLLHIESDFFIHPGTQKPYQTFLMYFTATDVSGEISTEFFDAHEKEVASEAKWHDVNSLSTLTFFNPLKTEGSVALVRKAVESDM